MSAEIDTAAALEDEELESQEFREALLSRLNGQSEDLQRLIKLVDNRFVSQSRRIKKIEDHVTVMQPVVNDVRMIKRLVFASIPLIATFVTAGIKILEMVVK